MLLPHAGRVEGEEGPEDPEGDKPDDGKERQQDVEVGVYHTGQEGPEERAGDQEEGVQDTHVE